MHICFRIEQKRWDRKDTIIGPIESIKYTIMSRVPFRHYFFIIYIGICIAIGRLLGACETS